MEEGRLVLLYLMAMILGVIGLGILFSGRDE